MSTQRPHRDTVTMSVSIGPDMLADVTQRARELDLSVSQYVRRLIREQFAREEVDHDDES